MEKVYVHENNEEDIHFIDKPFFDAYFAICGKKLYPINTIHTKKLRVSCVQCLKKESSLILGIWPEDDLRRAFVAGASWWEFTSREATMWPSDREEAEEAAEEKYPEGKLKWQNSR